MIKNNFCLAWYQLPIVFFALPSTNDQLFIGNCLLHITNCRLPMTKQPNNISISFQFSNKLDSKELYSCLTTLNILYVLTFYFRNISILGTSTLINNFTRITNINKYNEIFRNTFSPSSINWIFILDHVDDTWW